MEAAFVDAPVSAGGVVDAGGVVVSSALGPHAASNEAKAAIKKTFFIFIPFISEFTLLARKLPSNEG